MAADLQRETRALGGPARHRVFRYIADAPQPVRVVELTGYVPARRTPASRSTEGRRPGTGQTDGCDRPGLLGGHGRGLRRCPRGGRSRASPARITRAALTGPTVTFRALATCLIRPLTALSAWRHLRRDPPARFRADMWMIVFPAAYAPAGMQLGAAAWLR